MKYLVRVLKLLTFPVFIVAFLVIALVAPLVGYIVYGRGIEGIKKTMIIEEKYTKWL